MGDKEKIKRLEEDIYELICLREQADILIEHQRKVIEQYEEAEQTFINSLELILEDYKSG